MLIFTVGIIFGAVLIKALGDSPKEILLLKYSSAYFYNVFNNNYNKGGIFKKALFNNLIFIGITYLAGLANFGFIITPLIIFLNGGLLGYSVGYLTYNYGLKGFFISILGFYPQYIFYVVAIVSIGALSMTMSYKYKFSGSLKINKTKKLELIDYTFFIIVLTLILIIGCSYEGFISPIFLNLIN
jgi:stage II sporulation protein M